MKQSLRNHSSFSLIFRLWFNPYRGLLCSACSKHLLITNLILFSSCPMDPTVQFYESQHARKRFTFNSFQFVGTSQRFVFVHCKLVVCNATDPSSRCSKGCQSSSTQSRLRRSVSTSDYDFTQGPILVSESKHSKTERFHGLGE